MSKEQSGFWKLVNRPVPFRLFLLAKLPAAFFSGISLKYATVESCAVTVPYGWRTRNPFRCTYFACLAMAAEMSTGLLAMAQVYGRQPKVSMLVTGLTARYFKKATGLTTFICKDGLLMKTAVEKAVQSGEGQTAEAVTIGYNSENEVIAQFNITWSFKVKPSLPNPSGGGFRSDNLSGSS
jgi:hypothetical protein